GTRRTCPQHALDFSAPLPRALVLHLLASNQGLLRPLKPKTCLHLLVCCLLPLHHWLLQVLISKQAFTMRRLKRCLPCNLVCYPAINDQATLVLLCPSTIQMEDSSHHRQHHLCSHSRQATTPVLCPHSSPLAPDWDTPMDHQAICLLHPKN